MSMLSTPGFIATALMVLLSLAVIGYPLLGKQFSLGAKARRQRLQDELLTNYERIVATIRDLDEDYNTGKLNESDYVPEREYWAARGVELLQQLDELGGIVTSQNGQDSAREDVDDDIEDAVARYRAEMKVQTQHEPSSVH